MKVKLRAVVGTAIVAVAAMSLSATAMAEARQVGGNKATWDKACQKSKDCMPIGDLGGGVNGYFVHDGKGGGTPVWCDANNCAAGREVKPTRDAVRILEQPADQLGAAVGKKQPALTGNEDPATLLRMN